MTRLMCWRLLVLCFVVSPVNAEESFSGFSDWLMDTARLAVSKGIREETVEQAFSGLSPDPRVLGFDRAQPEFVQTFDEYLEARVTGYRIRKAREHFRRESNLLEKIASRYQVDPEFLVAFWGMESNFGQYQGKYSVIRSLATLGFDARRSAFFTRELIDALQILDEGHVSLENFLGGWAGAMGQNQFMPSSFLGYAVDFDGDGKKDIWSTRADVWASIASYLHRNGWRRGAGWGGEVDLPEGFDPDALQPESNAAGCRAKHHHSEPRTMVQWEAMGLTPLSSLSPERPLAMVLPASSENRNFLVGGNFDVILRYNCANKYAVSVGLLADRIVATDPADTASQ